MRPPPPPRVHRVCRLPFGLLVVALSSASLARPARAQDLQSWQPAALETDLLTIEGARTLYRDRWAAALHVGYGVEPLVERDPDSAIARRVIDGMLVIEPQIAYGVVDRFMVGLSLPMVSSGGDTAIECHPAATRCTPRELGGFGLGDLRLEPRYRLVDGGRDDRWGLTFALPVSLPTGDEDKLLGGSSVALTPRLIAEARASIVRFVVNLAFRWRPESDTFQNIEVGNEVLYGGGVRVETGVGSLAALVEMQGAFAAQSVVDDQVTNPLEVLFGLRWHDRTGLLVTGGGGVGVNPDRGTPKARVMFALGYERHPDVPVPPPDLGAIDSDGDGLTDDVDRCPREAEDVDGFLDADGCPELDNDRDGYPDASDKCPMRAEVVNGVDDEDGCPDGEEDRDGDRVPDTLDPCPDEPEDRDDFEDTDGCPEADNDGDQIPDVRDRCPDEAERVNGRDDDDGCPEDGFVQLVGKEIQILQPIEFELGGPIMLASAKPILDDIAGLLNARKDLQLIVIEGHTDERGTPRDDLVLSRERARNVRAALIRRGVWRGRLAATGYGSSQALAQGDPRNRRTELRVTTAALAPNLVQALHIGLDGDNFVFTFRTTRAVDPTTVRVWLDGPRVVVVKVPQLDVARELLQFQHLLVERVLILAAAGDVDAAILRVRFKRDVPADLAGRVVSDRDASGALRVTMPPP